MKIIVVDFQICSKTIHAKKKKKRKRKREREREKKKVLRRLIQRQVVFKDVLAEDRNPGEFRRKEVCA